VIDAPTQTILRDIFRRESRSVLQYLAESFPWTTPERQAVTDHLRTWAGEERAAAARLATYLQRNQVGLPYLGAFPTEFTNINFIGLDYAVGRIIESEKRSLADLQRDLNNLGDPTARDLVQEMVAIKQRHLQALQELAPGLPAATLK
jgi:hypothetical protein